MITLKIKYFKKQYPVVKVFFDESQRGSLVQSGIDLDAAIDEFLFACANEGNLSRPPLGQLVLVSTMMLIAQIW